jgi:Icc-related predicted phosphoesterase
MILTGISDNHGNYDYRDEYSEVELLIHSGDLFSDDMWQDKEKFRSIILSLQKTFPNAIIIIVPGNHDFCLETLTKQELYQMFGDRVVMLVNELIEIGGLRIYGDPYTSLEQAFQRRGNYSDISEIPGDLDILVTHEAPRCFDLDFIRRRDGHSEPGCIELYDKVKEVKPRYHFFGHIHNNGNGVIGDTHYFNNSQMKGNIFTPNITLLDIKPVEP